MILSKQKYCLWSTGVSTESQNLISVLHSRQDFLATRNMTRVNVGLARGYVKLLLSSWKIYEECPEKFADTANKSHIVYHRLM